MLKTLAAAIAILGAVALPAAADRGQPSPSMTLTAKLGADYDLHRRDHKKEMPKDSETKATRSLTLAQVAAVAKIRHEEVAYCWDRLPPSQRIAGTAVLKFSIEPTGKVAELAITGDAPDAATSCLADCARRWMFPAADGKSEIEYPIRLR